MRIASSVGQQITGKMSALTMRKRLTRGEEAEEEAKEKAEAEAEAEEKAEEKAEENGRMAVVIVIPTRTKGTQ